MKKVIALLILLIGLLQYKLWFGEGNVLEFQRMNDQIAEMRQEGARRRERNAALEAEVMDLKQGLDAVEERARHELGMVMSGEEFVQVIDPQQPEPEQVPAPAQAKPAESAPEPPKPAKKPPSKKPPAEPAKAEPSKPAKKPADTEPKPKAATPDKKPAAAPAKPAEKPAPANKPPPTADKPKPAPTGGIKVDTPLLPD